MEGSSLTKGRITFYHAVTVCDCSRVEGSPHTRKNQLDSLRCLRPQCTKVTDRQPDGQTDRQTDGFTVA